MAIEIQQNTCLFLSRWKMGNRGKSKICKVPAYRICWLH